MTGSYSSAAVELSKTCRKSTRVTMEARNSHFLSLAEEQKNYAKDSFNAQDYDDTIACYTKAIEFNSENAECWAERALAYIQLKQYESALKDASKAIEIDSTFNKGFYSRGIAYLALKNLDAALEDLQQADKLNPNNADIERGLQECEGAITALRNNAELESQEPRVQSLDHKKRRILYAALIPLMAATVIMMFYLAMYFQRCFSDGVLGAECLIIFVSSVAAFLIGLCINLCQLPGFLWIQQQIWFLRRGHSSFSIFAFALGVVTCIPISFTRPITLWATLGAVFMVVWGFMVDVATDLDFGLSGVFCAVLVSIGIVLVTPSDIPTTRKDDNAAWLIVAGFALGGISSCSIDWTKRQFVLGHGEILERRIQEQLKIQQVAIHRYHDNQLEIAHISIGNKLLTTQLEHLDVETAKRDNEFEELYEEMLVADTEMHLLISHMSVLKQELKKVQAIEKDELAELQKLHYHHYDMLCQVWNREEELRRSRQTVNELNVRVRQREEAAWRRKMCRHNRTSSA